jgi:hypothetical protein
MFHKHIKMTEWVTSDIEILQPFFFFFGIAAGRKINTSCSAGSLHVMNR